MISSINTKLIFLILFDALSYRDGVKRALNGADWGACESVNSLLITEYCSTKKK